MLNGQFTWLTPFIQQEGPGFAWHTKGAKNAKGASVMTENEIATEIVDAAYKVHTTLGPGLLESVYEAVVASELEKRKPKVDVVV